MHVLTLNESLCSICGQVGSYCICADENAPLLPPTIQQMLGEKQTKEEAEKEREEKLKALGGYPAL